MDHSEARTTREDASAAAHLEASPQRSPSLTFHPARDDPAQLRSFLKAVCEKHARQTESRGNSSQIDQRGESAHLDDLYRQFTEPLHAGLAVARSLDGVAPGPLHAGLAVARPLDGGAPTGNVTSPLDSRKRSAVDLHNLPPSAPPKPPPPPLESPPIAAMPAPAPRGPRRRRRSTNQASLLRAKNIDFHKPDPEEDSPPNETEDERRRRRERINGRRKRAKKMIEIDFLNEQYHILRNENTRLKNENDGFRERISMLRRFSASSNRVPPPQARDPTRDLAVTDAEHREALVNKDEDGAGTVAQQKPSPEQKAEFDPGRQQRPSLLQYALAPSAFVLRHMREDIGGASPSEETKDSFVQPQFVGQERLGNNPILAGAPGLAARPQFGSLFASLQAGAPSPQSSSIMSALFQHRHNASAAAQPPAHSQGESLLSFPPEQRQVFQLLRGSGANRPEQLSQQHRQLQQLQLLQQQLQRQQHQHQNQQTQRDNAHDQNAPS